MFFTQLKMAELAIIMMIQVIGDETLIQKINTPIDNYEFCHGGLTKYQLVNNMRWDEYECSFVCDILDLSKPIGSSKRFIERRYVYSFTDCVDNGTKLESHICYRGRCVQGLTKVLSSKDPFPKFRPIHPNLTDLETRICYRGLEEQKWVANAYFTNHSCVLECEILDTNVTLGSKERNYYDQHEISSEPCKDNEHVCQLGRCVKKTLSTILPYREFSLSSDEGKKNKIDMCTERKAYCDREPHTKDWVAPSTDLDKNCFSYEMECTDVPGFESDHWHHIY